jgi:putative phage-type endonuclease
MSNILQNREEWLKLRKNYLGASDAPVIMNGMHFNKTPYKLWKEKLGIGAGTKDNGAMQYGRRNEEPARRAYEKYTSNLMTEEVVFHPEKKFMMATLDGLSFNGDVAVEIKCPGEADHSVARQGRVPEKYMPQLQHQLACIGINQIHYYSYRDGKGILIEVGRDDKYIDRIYQEEGSFWEKVLKLEAPGLMAKDYQNMEEMDEWERVAKDWSILNRDLKALEEKEKSFRKKLIKMAGDGNAMGHGLLVSRIVRRGSVDYKAIPELQNVELDKYRKGAIESWRVETVA